MMRELLAALLIGIVITAMVSPETAGDWYKRFDEARFGNIEPQ